jgi:hypothetical protein
MAHADTSRTQWWPCHQASIDDGAPRGICLRGRIEAADREGELSVKVSFGVSLGAVLLRREDVQQFMSC